MERVIVDNEGTAADYEVADTDKQPEWPPMDKVRTSEDDWWEEEGERIAYERQMGQLETALEHRTTAPAITVTGPMAKVGDRVLTGTLVLTPFAAEILSKMLDRMVKASKV